MNTGLSESPMIFKSILRIYLIFVICLLCTLIFQIKVSVRIGIRLNLITQRIHYYLNLLPLEREKKWVSFGMKPTYWLLTVLNMNTPSLNAPSTYVPFSLHLCLFLSMSHKHIPLVCSSVNSIPLPKYLCNLSFQFSA